jgi:hypothetical protein
MISVEDLDRPSPRATDGEIAAINLDSARHRAWARFGQDARVPGIAEALVEMEGQEAQFFGDLDALDRLETLASQFASVEDSSRAALISATVASAVHCFDDARAYLVRAALMGGPRDEIERHSLTLNQACGVELDAVLAARYRISEASGHLGDLVSLGALLADLDRFGEADAVYRRAFYSYEGGSPFPLAWVCFQLGVLWGEIVPIPEAERAALWYQRAIAYVPGYVKARVHLAEIYAAQNQIAYAEALLVPALSSRDPEVRWRLADVLTAQERFEEAETQLAAARVGFDALLCKHPLAFADHAAEFYAGSGNNHQRARELAHANVANRPTIRAIRQANALAYRYTGENA